MMDRRKEEWKEGRVYFDSHVEGAVLHGGECEMAGHITSSVKKQRAMNAGSLSTSSLLFSS